MATILLLTPNAVGCNVLYKDIENDHDARCYMEFIRVMYGSTCTHTHMHACMHARTHARMHTRTHTHTHIHTYTHTHIHTHTRTHTHTHT